MGNSTGGGDFLHELETEVDAELNLAEQSRPEEVTEPSTEWLYDPMDAQREAIGLRSLLGAIEVAEGDAPRNGDHTTGA